MDGTKVNVGDEVVINHSKPAPVDLEKFFMGEDVQPTDVDEEEKKAIMAMLDESEDNEGLEQTEPEEAQEDEGDQEGPENEEPDGAQDHDTIPKKAMLAERKKYQKRLEEQSPYAELGKAIAEARGLKDPQQILESLTDVLAEEYAEKNGMPLEDARREVATKAKERDLKRRESLIGLRDEANSLKNSTTYTMLADEETREEVVQYAAKKDLTVKQACRVLFEDVYLANVSKKTKSATRKKPSQSTKPSGTKGGSAASLTAEELQIAKLCGVSAEEWAKWK